MGSQRIKRAQVYGMRCSGTNYLDALLQNNFPTLSFSATSPTSPKTFGWKHGDVGTTTYIHTDNGLMDAEIMPLNWALSRDTILFVVFRNPITWIQSLHRNPHNIPEAYNVPFSTFIRQRLRSYHTDPPGSESSPLKTVRKQQLRISRLIEDHDSPLDMRKIKIRVFESFKYRFHNVFYCNLETLEQDPERILRNIAECYKLPMIAKFKDIGTYKGGETPYHKSTYDPISNEDLQYILAHIDWPTESRIGYVPRLSAKLLTRQTRVQEEPDSLLHIFPYSRYYLNAHSLYPSSTQG
jgi:hypothetical protein